MIIRHLRRYLFLLTLGSVAVSAQDLTLTTVTTGWREAASFKRISEYFSGHENTGGITMLRTHAEQRSGYYFLLSAQNTGAATAAQIILNLVMPTDQKPHTFTFKTDLTSGKTLLNLGLTGADWPNADTNPVAWKIDILATDGRLLTSEKSYLWDKPPGK